MIRTCGNPQLLTNYKAAATIILPCCGRSSTRAPCPNRSARPSETCRSGARVEGRRELAKPTTKFPSCNCNAACAEVREWHHSDGVYEAPGKTCQNSRSGPYSVASPKYTKCHIHDHHFWHLAACLQLPFLWRPPLSSFASLHHCIMNSIPRLLAAYDEELRTDAETLSAVAVRILGPLHLATFARGRGFITYRDLGGADSATIRNLVRETLDHYRADTSITMVEWKARAHDKAPDLHRTLTDNGFTAGETESIMIGEAQRLAVDVTLPQGVDLRMIVSEDEINRMTQMQAEVFGDLDPAAMARALIERLARKDGMELWVTKFDGDIICSGRLEPVERTRFAGIWGGATLPHWRGKGIYRALTAARARSAIAVGKTWIHSDSTEFSRPILERAGFLKVSETTPYVWLRGET